MKRILYIEDSVTSQKIFQRMFHPPHEVAIVTSPRAGNEYLATHPVDLVVCDYMFPQGDAFDVLIPLRRRHSALAIPFLAVSGSMDQVLISRLLTAGANACAAKPFHNVEFRTLLSTMLEQPFVAENQTGIVNACTFQWVADGHYHEYSPESGDHFHGPDRAEVSERMQARLDELRATGRLRGHIMQERTRSYVLRPECALGL